LRQAIDYADGLVRVGVQSALPHPETAALLRKLMKDRGLAVPPEGRSLASICVGGALQVERRGHPYIWWVSMQTFSRRSIPGSRFRTNRVVHGAV
jgi:hypothetical protein